MQTVSVVSEGTRFREIIAADTEGNLKTIHQERRGKEWIARFSTKSFNIVKDESKQRYPRRFESGGK